MKTSSKPRENAVCFANIDALSLTTLRKNAVPTDEAIASLTERLRAESRLRLIQLYKIVPLPRLQTQALLDALFLLESPDSTIRTELAWEIYNRDPVTFDMQFRTIIRDLGLDPNCDLPTPETYLRYAIIRELLCD